MQNHCKASEVYLKYGLNLRSLIKERMVFEQKDMHNFLLKYRNRVRRGLGAENKQFLRDLEYCRIVRG